MERAKGWEPGVLVQFLALILTDRRGEANHFSQASVYLSV